MAPGSIDMISNAASSITGDTIKKSFKTCGITEYGEVAACVVRVPTEVLKQRAQAFPKRTLRYVFRVTLMNEGVLGFYRGYRSTVFREIPFSFIQFPLWEILKTSFSEVISADGTAKQLDPFQSALCGTIAGTISAGVTTPLDVAKTRIMLSQKLHGPEFEGKILPVLQDVWEVQGFRGIFSGFLPRTLWMGFGGFVFFGAYEAACEFFGRRMVTETGTVPIEVTERWYDDQKRLIQDYTRSENAQERKVKTFEERLEEGKLLLAEREKYRAEKQEYRELLKQGVTHANPPTLPEFR